MATRGWRFRLVNGRLGPFVFRESMALEILAAAPDVSSDTEALVRAVGEAQHGSEPAFQILYRRFGPLVHGIALAHAGVDDAEDVVQDAFTRAWRALGDLENPGRFGAWLAEITRNVARDLRRRRRPTVILAEDDATVSQRPQAEARQVLARIQALPDAYKETLVLRLVEGMSGPEIASRTGLTPGSVRVNLHRGMELLRESLKERT